MLTGQHKLNKIIGSLAFIAVIAAIGVCLWALYRLPPWPQVHMILGSLQYDELHEQGGTRFLLARNQPELHTALARPETRKIIFADGETGPGVQFSFGPAMPATMALGAANDSELTRRFARWAGQGFRLLHIDAVLTPQADVFLTTAPAIIGWRSFGSNPTKVTRQLKAYIQGLNEGGVFPIVKHFPGHGMTPFDTHDQLGLTSESTREIFEVHVKPYRELLKSQLKFGILVGHLYAPELQNRILPASMSDYWMNRLRRGIGFNGLVITDSANMQPVQDLPGGEVRFTVGALRSGVDLILEPIDVTSDYEGYRAAIKSGAIQRQVLAESAKRLDKFFVQVESLRKIPKPRQHDWMRNGNALSREIMLKGAIEFGGRKSSSSLAISASNTVLVSSGDLDETADLLRKFDPTIPQRLLQFRPSEIPTSSPLCLFYWPGGTGEHMEKPWTPKQWNWLKQAEKRNTPITVIVFGNPLAGYQIRNFRNVKGVVVWGRSPASCQAAAAWLHKEFHPTGKWPFE